jgi:cytochrome c-type biogenesis protein CcmH/NrfG
MGPRRVPRPFPLRIRYNIAMSESPRRIAQLQRELVSNPASRQFYQLGELLRRDGRSEEAFRAR